MIYGVLSCGLFETPVVDAPKIVESGFIHLSRMIHEFGVRAQHVHDRNCKMKLYNSRSS